MTALACLCQHVLCTDANVAVGCGQAAGLSYVQEMKQQRRWGWLCLPSCHALAFRAVFVVTDQMRTQAVQLIATHKCLADL